MNYTELQDAISEYFKRGGIAGRIPAWIALAEAYLFRELAPKVIGAKVTGTTVGGLVVPPSDFNQVIRLSATIDGTEYNLDYIPAPDDYTNSSSYPSGYSMEGASIRLHPVASDGTAYTLYYTPKLEALSGSNPTNWLSENGADLYLYASALQGAIEMKNDSEIMRLTPLVDRLLGVVVTFSLRTPIPQSSGMQIKPRRAF